MGGYTTQLRTYPIAYRKGSGEGSKVNSSGSLLVASLVPFDIQLSSDNENWKELCQQENLCPSLLLDSQSSLSFPFEETMAALAHHFLSLHKM